MANVDIETTKIAGPDVVNVGCTASVFGVPQYTTRVQPRRVGLRASPRHHGARNLTATVVGMALGWLLVRDVAAEPLPASPAATAPRFATPVARPMWDLDGTYLWLGPVGAATWTAAPRERSESAWDSAFGADLAVVRVREHAPLGVIGGSAGASRSARHGGRLWLDAVIGTALAGHMVGASAGPIVALSDDRHPQFGGSIRIWGYAGIAPYARFGVVGSSAFMEIGIHFPLPVLRR